MQSSLSRKGKRNHKKRVKGKQQGATTPPIMTLHLGVKSARIPARDRQLHCDLHHSSARWTGIIANRDMNPVVYRLGSSARQKKKKKEVNKAAHQLES